MADASSSPLSYAEAVSVALEWCARVDRREPHELAAAYAAAPEVDRAAMLAWWIRCAAWSDAARDALRLIVRQHRRDGRPLPGALVEFAIGEFADGRQGDGERRRPGRPREIPAEVVLAVRDLRRRDYGPLTRNADTGRPVSACDAVAAAFDLSYRQVATAWQVYRRWERRPVPPAMLAWIGVPVMKTP